jgi:taurine---2-oxoglutarate transaminase
MSNTPTTRSSFCTVIVLQDTVHSGTRGNLQSSVTATATATTISNNDNNSCPTAMPPKTVPKQQQRPAPFDDTIATTLALHDQPMGSWTVQQVQDKRDVHSFAMTWQCNTVRHSLPYIVRGQGIYLYAAAPVATTVDETRTALVGRHCTNPTLTNKNDCDIHHAGHDNTVGMNRNQDHEYSTGTEDGTVSQQPLPQPLQTTTTPTTQFVRYIDWTSQAVCANLGHSIPQQICTATMQQLQTLPYLYSGLGISEIKVRLTTLFNEEILPKPLVVAVYPTSGAEANEAGLLLARRYTKRSKILSFYRSYHGATPLASSITGDYRRWYNETHTTGGGGGSGGGGSGGSGNSHYYHQADDYSTTTSTTSQFIKAFNPYPLFFQHAGTTTQEQIVSALHMLEEQIIQEGPYHIASIVMESIVGPGGCFLYPTQYVQGIRAICNKYHILLHFDEIMVGFGRTGTMFGFQHYADDDTGVVIPDILTVAKGITCAYIPLSMMACQKHILDYFDTVPLGWGSTCESHPVALATSYETMKYILREDIISHVQDVSVLFRNEMQRLTTIHPCIKQYRTIGLFGCFDVQDMDGCHPRLACEGDSPEQQVNTMAYDKYIQAYADNGLIGLHRYPHIHCAPPLIITKDELLDAFERLHQALLVLDEALGFPPATRTHNQLCTVTKKHNDRDQQTNARSGIK